MVDRQVRKKEGREAGEREERGRMDGQMAGWWPPPANSMWHHTVYGRAWYAVSTHEIVTCVSEDPRWLPFNRSCPSTNYLEYQNAVLSSSRAYSLGLTCDSPKEKQLQQHEQRQKEERKHLWTKSGTSGACFYSDDQNRMETICRTPTVVHLVSCLQRGSPLSVIGQPCLGQHPMSAVNILFPILQKDLPVGCEMSISRKHKMRLIIKMLSN